MARLLCREDVRAFDGSAQTRPGLETSGGDQGERGDIKGDQNVQKSTAG